MMTSSSNVALPQNGGSFYMPSASSVLVDPFVSPPVMQNQLASELARCEDLVRRDFRYAHLVAGASKMPMNMIWVARNQGGDVNDSDLASLRDVAWNEFVKKRFLPSVAEGTPVADAAVSMLEIVRSMNLQRKRFQIMGLHEQVEASELQLVLHLCQAGLLHNTGEYRITANRFRRHDKFFEAFALAVGAFVCASAPFTLGVATTQLNRSLQYDYKKHTIALFVYVLQQHRALINSVAGGGLDEDYVARIARLIIVSQQEGDSGVAGHREDECEESRRRDNESFLRSVMDSVQRLADRVDRISERMDREPQPRTPAARGNSDRHDMMERLVRETVERRMGEIRENNSRTVDAIRRENTEMRALFEEKHAAMQERMERMNGEFVTFSRSTLHGHTEFTRSLQESFDRHSANIADDVRNAKVEISEAKNSMQREILDDRSKLMERFDSLERKIQEQQAFASRTHFSPQPLPPPAAALGSDQAVTQQQMEQMMTQIAGGVLNESWERTKSEFEQRLNDQIQIQIRNALAGTVKNEIAGSFSAPLATLGTYVHENISRLQTELVRISNESNALSAQQAGVGAILNQFQPLLAQMPQWATHDMVGELRQRITSSETRVSQLEGGLREAHSLIQRCMDEQDFMQDRMESGSRKQESGAGVQAAAVKREPGIEPDEIRRIAEDVYSRGFRNPENITIIAGEVSRSGALTSLIDTRLQSIEGRLALVENSRGISGNQQVFTVFGNDQSGASSARYTVRQRSQPPAAAAEGVVVAENQDMGGAGMGELEGQGGMRT